MTFLSDKIKQQELPISFLLIITIFVSLGFFTIKGLYTLENLTRTIYDHPLVVSNASLQAALNITKMHRGLNDAVLANSPDEIEYALNTVSECEQKVYQQLDLVRENILGEEGRGLQKQTRLLFDIWQPVREDVIRLIQSGNKQKAILITTTTGADHAARLESKMQELTSYARNKADMFLKAAEDSQAKLEKLTILLTVIGVFISIIIAFIATRLVSKSERLLQEKNNTLQKALDEIKTLRGILPICSFCKNIRNDQGYYEQIEEYIHKHSGVDFSHTICPSCMQKHYPKEFERIAARKNISD